MHTWSSSTEPGRSEPDWIHKGISILELDDGAVPQGTALIYKAVVVRKASEDIWVGRRGWCKPVHVNVCWSTVRHTRIDYLDTESRDSRWAIASLRYANVFIGAFICNIQHRHPVIPLNISQHKVLPLLESSHACCFFLCWTSLSAWWNRDAPRRRTRHCETPGPKARMQLYLPLEALLLSTTRAEL